MEMKDGTHIRFLFRTDIFLVVSAAEECEHHTVSSQRRLDNIRNIFLFRLVVEVSQILTGYVLMLCQVVICTVSDSPQLAPSEREEEFHVCCRLAVEGQFFFIVIAIAYFVVFESEGRQPVQAEALPVIKPLKIRIRLAEELKLHLLELSCTECKVARCDLITE